jgi:hypothetical protein
MTDIGISYLFLVENVKRIGHLEVDMMAIILK